MLNQTKVMSSHEIGSMELSRRVSRARIDQMVGIPWGRCSPARLLVPYKRTSTKSDFGSGLLKLVCRWGRLQVAHPSTLCRRDMSSSAKAQTVSHHHQTEFTSSLGVVTVGAQSVSITWLDGTSTD